MIIYNGFVLLLLRKLCVWQILQKGDPQLLPPPQHNRDNKHDICVPKTGSLAFEMPIIMPSYLSLIYVIANVYWALKILNKELHILFLL